MRKKINDLLESKRAEILADVCSLVKINSTRSAPSENMPFGENAAKALKTAEAIAARLDLACENVDNYALHADASPKKETALAILAHLDIVEAGDGWTTPPFEPQISNGKIIGRGTADNKGPAVAALHALAAAKQLAPQMSKNARVILGSAEETGSEDLAYYFKKFAPPPMSFSPDAEYPVINIEKGAYGPAFSTAYPAQNSGKRVVKMTGGKTNNIVPHIATALIKGFTKAEIIPAAEEYEKKLGVRFSLETAENAPKPLENDPNISKSCANEENTLLKLTCTGKSAHASTPHLGINAQTALIELLCALLPDNGGANTAVKKLSKAFPHGDWRAQALDIAMSDAESGDLTLNFGVLELTETGFTARFDSRVPLCGSEKTVAEKVRKAFAEAGFRITDGDSMKPPHKTPADSPLVQTLLKLYESYTGEKGRCLAIGGGTYAHGIPGAVAFGCEIPGVGNNIHGADEFMDIEVLMMSAKMFCEAIISLC